MTTASKVTLARVCVIPLFMWAALMGWSIWALGLFVAASATDWLDGYIARKYNQISDFGKFMDPLADKLLVFSALLLFVQWGRAPAWIVMVLLAREFAVSGLRMVASSKGHVIAAGVSGKVKTAVTMVGLTLMLTSFYDAVVFSTVTVDQITIYAILLTTVYSGGEYLLVNRKILFD